MLAAHGTDQLSFHRTVVVNMSRVMRFPSSVAPCLCRGGGRVGVGERFNTKLDDISLCSRETVKKTLN